MNSALLISNQNRVWQTDLWTKSRPGTVDKILLGYSNDHFFIFYDKHTYYNIKVE